MKFGIIGSGSWGTALAKILTDNNKSINWWIRSEAIMTHFKNRHHNPQYLSSAYFDTSLLHLTINVAEVIHNSDCVIIVVPSAYAVEVLGGLPKNIFQNKKIISAIKGILPEQNLLLNDYLKTEFSVELKNYFTVLGPCHAEEVAAEKLSYLTFSGIDEETTKAIASHFKTPYLNTLPFICILAPLTCFFIDRYSTKLFGGYVFAEELIIVNGLLTFIGLLLVSGKKSSAEIKLAHDRNNK